MRRSKRYGTDGCEEEEGKERLVSLGLERRKEGRERERERKGRRTEIPRR